jgi:pantothenate kinase type III
MRVGAQVGYRGIVREIVAHLKSQMGADFRLVATGGYTGWALNGSGMPFVIDPELCLFGLGRLFETASEAAGE